MPILSGSLPEVTDHLRREGCRFLRAYHRFMPCSQCGADVPQLHGSQQCGPDGSTGQACQPCKGGQRQQVVHRPEQPPAGAENGKQLDEGRRQRQNGQRCPVGGNDIADGKAGQHTADKAERPVPPHSGQYAPPRRCERDRQGRQHTETQIGKGIIVAIDLILCRQQAAVENTVHPHGVPQCVQVHGKITVQRLPAAGGGAVEKAQHPAQQNRTGHIGAEKKRRAQVLPFLHGVFQQERQRNGVGHGQKIGVDAHGDHIEEKQPRRGVPPLPPQREIAVQRCQNKPLCA